MSDQPAVETTQEVAVEPATESTGTSTTDIDWKSTLSDDLKNSGSIQSLNTVEDVVKKLVNAEAMIGKDRVILPGKDATPEQWNEFHTKMGRPETIDGYDFSQTETEVSEDSTKQVRDLAFQLGLDKKGGAVLHNALGEAAKRGQDLQKEQIEIPSIYFAHTRATFLRDGLIWSADDAVVYRDKDEEIEDSFIKMLKILSLLIGNKE